MWHEGKVVLQDHDLLAERSLAALGAKPPMCLRIFDAWRDMRDSEIVCELLLRDAARSPGLLAGVKVTHDARKRPRHEAPPPMPARVANRPRRPRPPSRRERQDVQRQREKRWWAAALVEALPPSLRTALALSAIVNFQRHWHDAGFRAEHAKHIEPAVTALVTPLFEYSVRRWRRFKPRARFLAVASLLAPGEPPTCAARAVDDGAFGELALSISWFTDVWARDLALLDHCFVLGLAPAYGDGEQLGVLALRWEHQDWRSARSVVAPARVTEPRPGELRLQWL